MSTTTEWPIKSLDELAERIDYGHTASADRDAVGPKFLRITDIQNGHVDWNTVPHCPATPDELDKYRLNDGDIVFARTGNTTGKSFLLKEPPKDSIFASYLIRVRPSRLVDPRFLAHFFDTPKYWNQIEKNAQGAGQPGVNATRLKTLEIPLPPLSEQKRIADILDKADAIRRKRQEAKKLAATFQQGLFCEMFGDPITNEMNWPVKPFGAMAKNQDGRRKPVKASDRKDVQGEYPYYGASGIIDYVDSYIFDETALLIGEDGANLLARSTPIAFLATGKYWVNNHAHVVIPNGNATLLYLATHLNMRSIRDFVTGSAQPKLNQANLNKIPIPCPPIELQDEFDRRVNVFDKIRAKQTAADKESEDVSCSLVQRAFKGQL